MIRLRSLIEEDNAEDNSVEFTIRRAKQDDLLTLVKLEEYTSASPWSEKALGSDLLNETGAVVLVAEAANTENKSVIGYCDAWLVAGEAQLNNIAVFQQYRRCGVGEALLRELMEESRKAGCTTMNLEVRKSNIKAYALYEKLGFVKDGLRRGYYEDNGEDAVLMSVGL
ncbi:MAG: ribosomal protein S18-alanine N-acetyltransferase [Clostridiales bacterium]|nr:ribosomal protein S18-alanine N-acetyltransferase [Candidatus Crickella caballi]